MKPGNQRNKGKIGERKAVALLKSLGFADARRTVQYQGAGSSGDVVCPESLPNLHIEVKYTATIRLGTAELEAALTQACEDAAAAGSMPIVLWHEARRGWRVSWDGKIGMLTAIPSRYLLNELS